MTTYWFRPKRHGYGATPVTWQGWAVTLTAVAAIVTMSLFLRLTERYDWALVVMLGFDAVVVIALVIVSRRKTDGEWRWRWGERQS